MERFPFIPQRLPDEILYSWLARLVAYNSMFVPSRYIYLLFGSRDVIPCIDIPSSLTTMQSRLGSHSPWITIDDIIEQATLYPYHRAFITPQRDTEIRRLIGYGSGMGLKTLLGRVANRFGANPVLRYCRECALNDLRQFGIAYWHRCHQLPGVLACAVHGSALQVWHDQPSHANRHRLICPSIGIQDIHNQPMRDPMQIWLSKISATCLTSRLPAQDGETRRQLYFDAISESGFSKHNGHIDFISLADAVRNYYSDFDGFEHQFRLLSSPQTSLAWLRSVVGKPDSAQHPICHLILIRFLFPNFADYLDLRQRYARSPIKVSASTHSTKTAVSAQVLPDLIYRVELSCTEVAKKLKCSVNKVLTMRRAAGLPIAERPKRLTGPIVKEVIALLKKGRDPKEVALSVKLSLPTVYRIRASTPDLRAKNQSARLRTDKTLYRNIWRVAIRKGSDRGISEARKRIPAVYAWLYRNDRPWLIRVNGNYHAQPEPYPRVDWTKRDEHLTKQLLILASALSDRFHHQRISLTSLIRPLGEAMVRANLAKLPRLHALLNQLVETPDEYHKRRINGAITSLMESHQAVMLWKIQKLAGLRNWTPALRRYAENRCLHYQKE